METTGNYGDRYKVRQTLPQYRLQDRILLCLICKAARNLSLKRLGFKNREKRSAEVRLFLDELAAVLPDGRYAPNVSGKDAGKLLDKFLISQEKYVVLHPKQAERLLD